MEKDRGKGEKRKEGEREENKGKKRKKEKKPFVIELNSHKKIPRGNCLSSNFKEMTFRQLANGAFLPLPDIHHHFSLFDLLLPLVLSSGKQGPSGTSFCPPLGSAEHCLLDDVTLGNHRNPKSQIVPNSSMPPPGPSSGHDSATSQQGER